MFRTPRLTLPLVVVLLVVAVSLLVASGATGRSQKVPVNTIEPTITYVHPIQVGTILNGHQGSWDQSGLKFHFQWLRCNDNGEGCAKITNATGTTYTVVNADERHTLRLDVTAKNSAGEKATARANATGQVPVKPGAPSEVSAPTISGQAVVGQTLTATTGTWKGNQPISYTFKWQSCNSAETSCPANGGTGNTYVVRASDVGKRIRVKVLASNSAGQSAGLSDPTNIVSQSGGGGGGGSSVPVSSLVAGDRIVVQNVTFSPNPVTSRSEPIRVTIHLTDQKGKNVRDAFASIVSTPVLTSTPDAAQTDSNGTVVYTLTPRSNFPLKTGYSVQFYVKGYRQGDSTLAGVSGGRLVQVGTKG